MKRNLSAICKKNRLSFSDCEMFILRQNIDEIELHQNRRIVNSPEIKHILSIVTDFIRAKKLVIYGGQAINAVLPAYDQFYHADVDIPDWDCYDPTPVQHIKELSDIMVKEGFENVEAKSGQHLGTYKLFVNFNPVLDLTYIPPDLFSEIRRDAIAIEGFLYAPINLLRMSMYLELSRPAGNVGRWEKVLKRLALLNKHYPLQLTNCKHTQFERPFVGDQGEEQNRRKRGIIYRTVKNTVIRLGGVFFGGYAFTEYEHYMTKNTRGHAHKFKEGQGPVNPDFDVLSETPHEDALAVQRMLQKHPQLQDMDITIATHSAVGELIGESYEICVGKDSVAFIYGTTACHSYNIIRRRGQSVRIATIDTILSFYLAFLYTGMPYYDKDRIECIAAYLFKVQEKNRLSQKGVLRRFSMSCIGTQQTIESARAEKSAKFWELKEKRVPPSDTEYERWFLNYNPVQEIRKRKTRQRRRNNVQKKAATRRRRIT